MDTSTASPHKKRGRPPGSGKGESPQLKARVPQDLLDRLDAWAEAHGVDRSEATRRLLAAGLEVIPRPPATRSSRRESQDE